MTKTYMISAIVEDMKKKGVYTEKQIIRYQNWMRAEKKSAVEEIYRNRLIKK